MLSLAGHDKDKLYVVVQAGEFSLLCDGRRKLLHNPKKKNSRHLKETEMYVELSKYNPLYDAHIRKELKGLLK